MSLHECIIAEYLAHQQVKQRVGEVEVRGLLRDARAPHPGWLSRHGRWLLARLGSLLVGLGRSLERVEVPSVAAPDERQAVTSSD